MLHLGDRSEERAEPQDQQGEIERDVDHAPGRAAEQRQARKEGQLRRPHPQEIEKAQPMGGR